MDKKVSDPHLIKIAKFLPKWKVVARLLGLEREMVNDIEGRCRDGEEQRYEAMMKWVGKKGPQATYKKLYDVLQEIEEEEAAEKVKELATDSHSLASENSPAATLSLADSKKLYSDAMKSGIVERTVIKCLVIGAAGVGKTSIKHLLLYNSLPGKRVSTGVVETPTVAVSISSRAVKTDDGVWSVIQTGEDLIKIISNIIKAKAHDEISEPQDESPATSISFETRIEDLPETVKPMDDSTSKEFIGSIMEAKGGKNFLKTKWVHFIDSGGQPEFHDLLPLFVQNTSIVLFVLKSSEGLDEKPMVEYYDQNGCCIGEKHESKLTHIEILEHCLKVFCAQSEECPRILLVGTHKDLPDQKLNTMDLKKYLKSFDHKFVEFGKDQPIALLNCKSEGKEKDDIVKMIKQQVLGEETEGTVTIVNTDIEQTPMAWFGLELALKKASQSKDSKRSGILTYTECKQEAETFPYFRGADGQSKFNAALEHLVKHSIFLHYRKVLPDVVFCDPQILLTMVTQIVQHHYQLKQSSAQGIPAINFRDKAYISSSILERIFGDTNDVFTSESFLTLLLELKIIAKIGQDVYLMPALLPHAELVEDERDGKKYLAVLVEDETDDKKKHRTELVNESDGKTHLAPLCISFDGRCSPCGMFCLLVATLLQSKEDWKLSEIDKKPRCLFRNCVAFTFKNSTIIALVDDFSHFTIHMYIPIHVYQKSILLKLPATIREIVLKSISDIATMQLHCPKLKIQSAIKCPAHAKENHVALLDCETDEYKCIRDDGCIRPIPEDCKVWMDDTVQPCAPSPQPNAHPDLTIYSPPLKSGDKGSTSSKVTHHKQKESRTDEDKSSGCSLDDQIKDTGLTKVAENLPDWQGVFKELGMGTQVIRDIETNHRADDERRIAALRKWIEKEGSNATYRALCTALKSLGHKGAVQDITKIVGSSTSSSSLAPSSTGSKQYCKLWWWLLLLPIMLAIFLHVYQ